MKVRFKYEAFSKMRAYVNASFPEDDKPGKDGSHNLREITGWGLVDPMPNGDLYVSEVFLMPHEATAAHVEMGMDGWATMVQQLADDGRGEDFGRLSLWWHSHPFGNHEPHFSGTDTGTMERFNLQSGFLLSVVTTDFGNMTARYDQWNPARIAMEIPVQVDLPGLTDEDVAAVRAEVLEKVTFPAPKSYGWSGKYGDGWKKNQRSWNKDEYDGYSLGEYMRSQEAQVYDLDSLREDLDAHTEGQADVPEDPDGQWAVWRNSGHPYVVSTHRKKAEAEAAAKQYTEQLGHDYEVLHTSMELVVEEPTVDGLEPWEDLSYEVWRVQSNGGAKMVAVGADMAQAEEHLENLKKFMADNDPGDYEYEIRVEVVTICIGCNERTSALNPDHLCVACFGEKELDSRLDVTLDRLDT